MSAVVAAEEGAKALPTLLIKGEVVSVDSSDPAAVLLKVKDRYGFETPIYLPSEAKITQADKTLTVDGLAAGTAVEVEYNFDINTAKRHAVSVKVAASVAAAQAAAAVAPEVPAVPTDASAVAPVPEVVPTVPVEAAPIEAPQGEVPAANPSVQ